MFQFQNGSIKSLTKHTIWLFFPEFQFQNGSIKSVFAYWIDKPTLSFQFQNGSIKSTELDIGVTGAL